MVDGPGTGDGPVDVRVGWRALALVLWRGDSPLWHDDAACRDGDPRLWDLGKRQAERARAVCGTCPVRVECLADVIEWDTRSATHAREPVGVVGGLTAAERKSLYEAFPLSVGEPGDGLRRVPRR